MLMVEEVGDALMNSLKKDVDGAIYLVFPDMPILEVLDPAYPFILGLFAVGRLANAFGRGSLNSKEVNIILLFLFYVGFYLLHLMLTAIISFIFLGVTKLFC